MNVINIGNLVILIVIITIQMLIYYHVLTRPIINELKEIKKELKQLTQKEEKKSKDE